MMPLVRYDLDPHQALIAFFLGWKALLLAIAAGSAAVSPPYDTSAGINLLLSADGSGALTASTNQSALLARLTSWDAVYYVKAATRGYLFEQEWAFGSGVPTLISIIIKGGFCRFCCPM